MTLAALKPSDNYHFGMIPIGRLMPYANNSRKHSESQIQQVVNSINEFGFTNPVLVDESCAILAGHCRLMAAERIGMTDIPCITLRCLTVAQKRALVIADNRIALNADWDIGMLLGEIGSLQDSGFDIELTGFTLDEIADLTPETVSAGLTDDDSVPDVPVEPVTRPGDIYTLGNHRLMCGDSTMIDDVDRLMDGEKADMVFTDPPYGYKYESNHYKNGNPHGMLEGDDSIIDFMPILFSITKDDAALYICGSHQNIHLWRVLIDRHFKYKNLIVWKKNNWSMGDLKGAYAGQHELIIFAHKGTIKLRGERYRDIWEFDRDPPKDHPTQKPVDMIEFALTNTSDRGNNVIDLFGGSGSTLIACEKTGRKCYMMELSPQYCDVIVSRWERFTGKKAVLNVQ